jgi:hypothetical protein
MLVDCCLAMLTDYGKGEFFFSLQDIIGYKISLSGRCS